MTTFFFSTFTAALNCFDITSCQLTDIEVLPYSSSSSLRSHFPHLFIDSEVDKAVVCYVRNSICLSSGPRQHSSKNGKIFFFFYRVFRQLCVAKRVTPTQPATVACKMEAQSEYVHFAHTVGAC